jgi:hypothetical protein
MYRFFSYIVLFAAGWLGTFGGGAVGGESFRVDNAVYAEGKEEPVSRSVTIFYDDSVYDCMKTPDEVVVFETDKTNKTAGRFVLLNEARQIRAEVTAEKVAELFKQLRPEAAKARDPLVRFLAAPKFEQQYDEAAGELTLSSPLIRYRVTLAPEKNTDIVQQYHEFSDWYARLNVMMAPKSLPPFGRLEVNARIAERKALPSQVILTYTAGTETENPKQFSRRSAHQIVYLLTSSDLDRVAKARKQMQSFKLIPIDQYRKSGG